MKRRNNGEGMSGVYTHFVSFHLHIPHDVLLYIIDIYINMTMIGMCIGFTTSAVHLQISSGRSLFNSL